MARISDPSIINKLNSSKSNAIGDKIGSSLRNFLANQLLGTSQKTAEKTTEDLPLFAQQYSKGLSEGIPQTFLGGAKGLSELLQGPNIPKINLQDSESFPQSFGRLSGDVAGIGALSAPFAIGAEAVLPEIAASAAPYLGALSAGGTLTPGNWQDRLSGALQFAAPLALGKGVKELGKLGKENISAAFKKVTPEGTYQKIIDAYDKHNKQLGDLFQFVDKEATQRGINKVEELPEDLFNIAENYGYQTKSFKRLLSKAMKGEYNDVRKLYSELGRQERLALKAKNFEKADGLNEAKGMINDSLSEHFRLSGNNDLSQWLDTAKSGYANLKNVFEPQSNPMLRNLVGEERIIPGSFEPLMKNRTSINRIKELMPEIEQDIKVHQQKQANKEIYDKLKKAIKYGSAYELGAAASKRRGGNED